MDIQCRKGMRIILTSLAVVLAGVLAGCGQSASPPPPVLAAPPLHQPLEESQAATVDEDPRYVDAVTAFRAGDMEVAASLFVQVREASLDESTRRRALYGLACARLATAQDDKELAKAKGLWEAWRTESPPGGDGEDPGFMAAVLAQYRPVFQLKEIKASCERECDKRLQEKEEEVRRIIQRQVQALEEIHRQIQEKKKGLSNY